MKSIRVRLSILTYLKKPGICNVLLQHVEICQQVQLEQRCTSKCLPGTRLVKATQPPSQGLTWVVRLFEFYQRH